MKTYDSCGHAALHEAGTAIKASGWVKLHSGPSVDTWHHVVAVCNEGRVKQYFDGLEIDNGPEAIDPPDRSQGLT